MSIVIFILVLVALILVHEFGHFVAAKLFGMRVDEFGIGYPPKALTLWRKGETEYTLNWLPFGGFVRIFGEDPEEGNREQGTGNSRAFSAKPRPVQALVLFAGIFMNLAFAWLLISTTLVMGTPRALSEEDAARNPEAMLAVSSVLAGSPAEEAGLRSGDVVKSIEGAGGMYNGVLPSGFSAFVSEHEAGLPLTVTVESRDGSERRVTLAAKQGIVASDPERAALGVALVSVGTVEIPWYEAPLEGLKLTWQVTNDTAVALVHFFAGLFTFTADLSQVAGPVGIAGAVGVASESGLAALMTITALISINLALINVLPIPALDGGRLFFVLIESIIRRPLPPRFAGALNTLGFGLLILLMLVVTAHDIFKIVG